MKNSSRWKEFIKWWRDYDYKNVSVDDVLQAVSRKIYEIQKGEVKKQKGYGGYMKTSDKLIAVTCDAEDEDRKIMTEVIEEVKTLEHYLNVLKEIFGRNNNVVVNIEGVESHEKREMIISGWSIFRDFPEGYEEDK